MRISIDPGSALVYPEGWQSWTPTTEYGARAEPFGPVDERHRLMGYRAESPSGPGFAGEGLLAVLPATGEEVRVFATGGPHAVPTIRAVAEGSELVVSSDSDWIEHAGRTGDLGDALRGWASGFASGLLAAPPRPAPRVWCSWYQYFTGVTEADVVENLGAMAERDLPVDVVQIDDGYQQQIGDWLDFSDRFDDLGALAARIRAEGRRAGIWVAPYLVGAHSRLAAEHPDWLVAGADAGWNWDQRLHALDAANPAARDYLREVFGTLAAMGFDYFKLDFLYAGALHGTARDAEAAISTYRSGLALIRQAVGDDAYIVGCGAPTIASVGLVDAMRVSPDTAPYVEPGSGDLSSPGQRSAIMTGSARQWQNRTLWVNDPDCLLARPGVQQREVWASHVAGVDGLRTVSDGIGYLDEWGLRATRDYLAPRSPRIGARSR